MEQFKIDHFHAENPNLTFPKFYTLDENECKAIKRKIAHTYGISPKIDSLEFVNSVDLKSSAVPEINLNCYEVDVSFISKLVNKEPQTQIYINWHRFDKIDKMSYADFITYFDDLWYPGTDDIDLFDDTFNWIVSIDHEGYVKTLTKKHVQLSL